ncbi:MAG: glycosyltransferase family 4 protein, partial [Candidatus Riflebacteria bacterium]|nr:glycosyltransferase family 4 protein [Candidatus Riflebacteria bacterium]
LLLFLLAVVAGRRLARALESPGASASDPGDPGDGVLIDGPSASPAGLGALWLVDRLAQSLGYFVADLARHVHRLLKPWRRCRQLGLRNGLESVVWPLGLRTTRPAGRPRTAIGGPFFGRSWGRFSILWARAFRSERLLTDVVDPDDRAGIVPCDVHVGVAGHALARFRRLAATRPATVRVLRRECTHVLEVEQSLRREALHWGSLPSFHRPDQVEAALEEYGTADAIVVPSRFSRDGFQRRGVAIERLHIVNPGVDTRFFSPGRDCRSPRFMALFVGLLGLRKGAARLLRAWDRLDRPGGELWIVGKVQRDLPREVLPILDRPDVVHRPSVSRQELLELYRRAWTIALPSIEDGWGLSVHEAMACGTAPIVTPGAGVCQIVSDKVSGLVVPAGDEVALALALGEVAGDRGRTEAMGRAAREAALPLNEERYAAEVVARRDLPDPCVPFDQPAARAGPGERERPGRGLQGPDGQPRPGRLRRGPAVASSREAGCRRAR